jgi:hypothetical protein
MSGAGADEMPTTLKTAAESYLCAKAPSRATRSEYLSQTGLRGRPRPSRPSQEDKPFLPHFPLKKGANLPSQPPARTLRATRIDVDKGTVSGHWGKGRAAIDITPDPEPYAPALMDS